MVLSPEEQELYEERIESLRLAKSILEQKYDDGRERGIKAMITARKMLKSGTNIKDIIEAYWTD